MDKTITIQAVVFLIFIIIIALCTIFADSIDNARIHEAKAEEQSQKPIIFEGEVTVTPIILSEEEKINMYVDLICQDYSNVDPALVKSIIYYESSYNQYANNGQCIGLMQINTFYHARRAKDLGVFDLYSPYSNILVGVDYLSTLFKTCEDPEWVLMSYNMGYRAATDYYNRGIISEYAIKVLERAEEIKEREEKDEQKY